VGADLLDQAARLSVHLRSSALNPFDQLRCLLVKQRAEIFEGA